MIPLEQALAQIVKTVPRLDTEVVPLMSGLGRALGEKVVAAESLPPFNRSAMDGYAVRAQEISGATAAAPVRLRRLGTVAAGAARAGALEPGSAVRIFTGAMVPENADCVVPQEETEETAGEVAVKVSLAAGANVDPVGQDVKEGDTVFEAGEQLHARHIAMLAALGYAEVRVSKRPRVAILSTGSELVEVDEEITEGKVRNSNGYSLSCRIEESGAEPHPLGIADDTKEDLADKIELARDFDMLLISAGVSVGEKDLVKETLTEMGFQLGFWQVAVKPGKPILFGTLGKLVVFGLPGNPVSAMVSLDLFVRPALAAMQGRVGGRLTEMWAELSETVRHQPGRRNFMRGVVSANGGKNAVRLAGKQGSAILKSLADANCLVVVPEDASELPAGSKVRVLLLDTLA